MKETCLLNKSANDVPRVCVREASIAGTLIWSVRELHQLWSVRPIVVTVILLYLFARFGGGR